MSKIKDSSIDIIHASIKALCNGYDALQHRSRDEKCEPSNEVDAPDAEANIPEVQEVSNADI